MDIYKPIYTKFIKPIWLKYNNDDSLKYIPVIQQFHQKSIEEVRKYQLQRLQKIVTVAYNSVPFYRREWDDIGLKPLDIQSLQDIKKIPILTKDKLRAHTDEFIARGVTLFFCFSSSLFFLTNSALIFASLNLFLRFISWL